MLIQCAPNISSVSTARLSKPTEEKIESTPTTIPSSPLVLLPTAPPAAPAIPTLANVEIISTRPPIATIVPEPSVTPTNVPIPTPTTIHPPTCVIRVEDRFFALWSASAIYTRLGCPENQGYTTLTAEEGFERGSMLWRQDADRIYAIFDNGAWEGFADTFVEGDAEYSCGISSSSPSPRRGFSKVWCNNSNVRSALGNAVDSERGFCMAGGGSCEMFQDFSGGFMFYSERFRATYALINDGTWRR